MERQNKVLRVGWILNFYPAYSISERHSASLMLGVARCSWSGSSRGVWGIGVLEVEFLYNGVNGIK